MDKEKILEITKCKKIYDVFDEFVKEKIKTKKYMMFFKSRDLSDVRQKTKTIDFYSVYDFILEDKGDYKIVEQFLMTVTFSLDLEFVSKNVEYLGKFKATNGKDGLIFEEVV